MAKFVDAPCGATGTGLSRHGKAVPGDAQASGWRKATPGLIKAERHADAGERADIPKTRAFLAVKRVGAHIGLKAGDLLLLDTLGAFTQAQDWAAGQRPIVWASNAYLMDRTGFSLSALKRHARRLAEFGILSFRDSPNGKRWGRRDGEGRIVEAYGFDLSPLAARVDEFEHLHTRLTAERALCQRLKRRITVTRRMIRARIEAALSGALTGPWGRLARRFEQLLSQLPRHNSDSGTLKRILNLFTTLQGRVEAAFSSAMHGAGGVEEQSLTKANCPSLTQEMNPRGVKNDPYIQTTNDLDPVTCNRSETEQTADVSEETPSIGRVVKKSDDSVGDMRRKRGTSFELSTVMRACPEFARWAYDMGGYLKDWGDLHRAAGRLRPMIGISEQAWAMAQDRLGPHIATAAFVLTFDKHARGEVASPGGYLRGMVDKARAGELHLERSFHGRLSGQGSDCIAHRACV